MTNTTRRDFLGAVAASGATLAATQVAAAPEQLDVTKLKKDAETACVYHCDFGDPARFAQMLNNINNHLSVYEFDNFKIKIVVVVHSSPIKFFLTDLAGTPWEKETIDPDLYTRVTALSKYGVEFYLCQITYKRLKIDQAKTRSDPFLKFVPSGVATAADLQGKGFAYLKVG
jgi:uncharacterized protein